MSKHDQKYQTHALTPSRGISEYILIWHETVWPDTVEHTPTGDVT